MSDVARLEEMIEELRRLRNGCEPRNNQNPRYLRYSNAVSALLWIIGDLLAEDVGRESTERAEPGRGTGGTRVGRAQPVAR